MANDNKLVNLADLKEAFDDVKESIPSKTSQLTNDSGYITGYTETDPTVPSWAKASSKPSYSASEVGAKSTQSVVNSPTASGTALAFIDTITQNVQGVITPTKKTVASASQSAAGLMSADDKKKLDGIASGATANTGTVTSVATGVGLTGGTITGSGTLKAKLRSETALTIDSAAATTTSGRVYPVAVDKTGYLAVNVPWTDNNTTYSAGTGLSLSGTTFSNSGVTGIKGNAESRYRTGNVNLTPANIGALPTTGGDMTSGIRFIDSSSHPVGGINYVHDSSGSDRTFVIARTTDQSSNIQLGVIRNSDDTLDYWINEPAKFRQNAGITPANIGVLAMLNTATWSSVYSELSNVSAGHSAFVWLGDGEVMLMLTGGVYDFSYLSGIVTNLGSGNYRFNLFKGGNTYSFNVNNLSASGGTPGTFYTNMVKTKTVTATPDSNGNIHLVELSADSYVVVSAKASSLIATPWVSGGDGDWHARITAINGNPVTSGSVTVTVYYREV